MIKGDTLYKSYIDILRRELIPAMGCTEPIAVAYCASLAKKELGCIPDKVLVEVSGNIVKNVKSVIVPNTNGMKGIDVAAAIGILAGNPNAELEVISSVTDQEKELLVNYLKNTEFSIHSIDSEDLLDIIVTVYNGDNFARARINGDHTHVSLISHNNQVIYEDQTSVTDGSNISHIYDDLNIKDIFEFANIVELNDISETIERQIKYNSAISKEGLKNQYGANIGKVLLSSYTNSIKQRAKAAAAAGSDARMSGCELPVVVNSGSGNQGLTVSLPLIQYANEYHISEDKLYRGLVLSNLIAVHEKHGIGCLSAYCGAVSAGAAAGCGIAYLLGGDLEAISHTLVNALAITSGIICDGAKPSCAAKISASIDAGILGYEMYKNGQQFKSGDGIVEKGVENTLQNVSRIGFYGMRETDKEIIKIMTNQ